MTKLSVLIVAAGKGTRAGLSYPKTLHPVEGKPILIRILECLEIFDNNPTIIVSQKGKFPIKDCLNKYNKKAHLIIQNNPLGMGNAVLSFNDSPIAEQTKDIILVWGDIPFLRAQTVSKLVDSHIKKTNSFTLASIKVDSAYTIINRDKEGKVQSIIETREEGLQPTPGERDIGVFGVKEEKPIDVSPVYSN